MELVDWIQEKFYDNLLQQALDRIPDDIDKREGGIIFDALASLCYDLETAYMDLHNYMLNTFPTTAIGGWLDMKVLEQGLERYQATYSYNIAEFKDSLGEPLDVPINTRFSTSNIIDGFIYIVDEKLSDGQFILKAEVLGSSPSRYVGTLLPVDNVNNLGTATMTGNSITGRDVETDDELRNRYMVAIKDRPFGGNIVSYIQETLSIEGVGGVQVYPTFDGVGTVGLMVVDNIDEPATPDLMSRVKNYFDPEDGQGMSPIGHTVTVDTPTSVNLNITADVIFKAGVNTPQITEDIETNIEAYINEVKNDWGIHNELYEYETQVYVARVLVSILQTEGVNNASNVKINGFTNDLIWPQSMTDNKIPSLESVVIN